MNQELWRRVEDIFHAALERGLESRQTFLDEACNGDAVLRRRVEVLLSNEEQAGSFLEAPAIENLNAALMAGWLPTRTFGAYNILSALGSGGMGEVYRAHDSKLGRNVAVKVLPFEFARDPERLARFRREARTLASLNHPNIAAIYELVEESGEADYLVLELVEGETLLGPLPVNIALDYARQVADALEAAHDKGIIHRDLKPSNVKVTAQGRVKVLDFGLAKPMQGIDGNPDLVQGVAGMDAVSLAGRIAGTPGYMSPEQVRGEEVDARVDIWAFGCLLYELLAGKRAFAGATLQETTPNVLEREPDWQSLPAKTPRKICELLRKCVEKDARRRPQSIRDARRTIEQAQLGWNRWRGAAIATAVLSAVGIGVMLWLQASARSPNRDEWIQLTRLPDPVSQPALSPDGRKLAFVRSASTLLALGQIYVKTLPDGEPIQLTHDNNKKMSPAFSPDGRSVYYTSVDAQFNWETWMVAAQGGEPQWLRNATSLTWIGPRQVMFSSRPERRGVGIVTAEQGGTGEREVYFPMHDLGMAMRSQASPDGKWVLLAEITGYGNWGRCRVVPMDGSSQGRLVGPPGAECSFGAWSPDGKWMYLTSKPGELAHIWRQRFPDGRPEQFTAGLTEEEGIAIAPDGRSMVTAVGLQSAAIWVHDTNGERQISLLEGNAADPKFTPDGKQLCYRIMKAVPALGKEPGEVWVADLISGHSEPLAPGFAVLDYNLSGDGKQVVMGASDAEGKPRLWLAPLDRRSPPRQIPGVEGQSAQFGPTGEVFFRRKEGSSGFLYRVRPDGTGLRKALEQPIFTFEIAPGGDWIAAWAPSFEKSHIVKMFPLDGGAPIVVGSDTSLQWSSGGDTLWISAGAVPDGRTYIVPLTSGKILPPIPPGGFRSEQEIAHLPGARMMDRTGAPSPHRDVYAFDRRTVQRNLYSIPIP